MEKSNFELFYDVFFESMQFLYERTHENFFALFFATANNIINVTVSEELSEEDRKELFAIYERLENIDFNSEDIRKVLQVLILRGFKEENLKNGELTPDTIGIFISYLTQKFFPKDKTLSIFDPALGSGNLLVTVANHIQNEVVLYGADNNDFMIRLSNAVATLCSYEVNIFFEDSTLVPLKNMDIVLFDINDYEIENREFGPRFSHNIVLRQLDSLNDEGIMFAVINNDFFDSDHSGTVRKAILEKASIVGIIELPKTLFKENAKSILILDKSKKNYSRCLIASLPSFEDIKEVNKILLQLEMWFNELGKEKKL